ncbi:hypothetical protein [Acidiferrobacter sp. SPIII_3]|nr:hypothetical protein [Acidiferrobacter sp. SPIII_3]
MGQLPMEAIAARTGLGAERQDLPLGGLSFFTSFTTASGVLAISP